MKHTGKFLLAALLSLASPALFAGKAEVKPREGWSLEKCIQYGLEHNPGLKQVTASRKGTQGQNDVLKSEFLPKVNAGYSVLKNNQTELPVTEAQKKRVPPSQYSDQVFSLGANVSQTVYSKKRAPTFELARTNVLLTEADIRQVKNDLVLSIKKAFYNTIFTGQNYKITVAAEAVAKDNLTISEALYKEGKVSSFDVSRTKVRWISAKADTLSAKNSNTVALEALKTVLSLPQEENLSVDGRFPESVRDVDLPNSISEALEYRPEIEQLKLLQSIKKDSVEIAKAGYYPTLNAGLSYSYSSPDLNANIGDQYKSWTATFSVSVPIFDGLLTRGRIKVAESELEQTLLGIQSVQNGVIMEIRQAYFTLKNAEESLSAQKESVSIAKENLSIARERYRMGLLSLLELKDVELSLIAAETQYIKTLYDYHTAFVTLERAVGLPFRSREDL